MGEGKAGSKCWGIAAATPNGVDQIVVELNPVAYGRGQSVGDATKRLAIAVQIVLAYADDKGLLAVPLPADMIGRVRQNALAACPALFGADVPDGVWMVKEGPGEVLIATSTFRLAILSNTEAVGRALLHGPWIYAFALACTSDPKLATWADFAVPSAQASFTIEAEYRHGGRASVGDA